VRNAKSLLLSFGMLALATACLGEPIPKRVVAGTTFTFPLDTFLVSGAAPLAYGADPAANPGTVLLEDRQRGNVRFVLCEGVEPQCGTERPLVTRYITRLSPDRGSRLGRSGALEIAAEDGTTTLPNRLTGQPIAVLDVPVSMPSGNYQITYIVRVPGETSDRRLTLQPLEVIGSTKLAFTDITRALNLASADRSTTSLQGFVPDPQLELLLTDADTAEDLPAAGTIVLKHPEGVEIQGAFEGAVLGQGSMVRVSPGPTPDTVSIMFMDPDRKTDLLRVAFQLAADAKRVAPQDFAIVEQSLYDIDGAVLPVTQDPAQSGNSFRLGEIF